MKRFLNRGSALKHVMSGPGSERGMALVVVLVLSAAALAVISALLYMLTIGTGISGAQKRYRSSVDAGIGGVSIIYQVVAARGNPGLTFLPSFQITGDGSCLNTKLNNPTASWGVCDSSLIIDPANSATSFDMRFDLPGADLATTYTVYGKIVDTVEGNSGGDLGLIKGGVVNSNSGEVAVVSIPYLYTIELDVENAASRAERAKLSVLYQY